MRFISVVLGVSIAAGCSAHQRASAEKSVAQLLVSDQDEAKLGAQVQAELDKQGTKYLTDATVVNYVNQVAGKLLTFAKRDRPNVPWDIKVINDPKQVNAFAVPGGHLYVYSGLLLAADNEAELAGVLAHEAGHVVGRHSARALVNQYGLQTVTSLALGENPNQIAAIAAQLAGTGVLLAHSRGEEQEADEYGARYTSAAGYDPHGLVTFFQKLQAQQGKTPKILTFLQTHPATDDRIAHVNQYIAQNRLGGTDTGAQRLAPVKQKLQAAAGSSAPAGQK
ncbi:MAG: M48 family metallopeptidase [Myxococcaceae bacterium]